MKFNDIVEISIILPVRIDSDERKRNLGNCLRFINLNFPHSEIMVIENDKLTRLIDLQTEYKNVIFNFLFEDEPFNKTKSINFGILNANFPVVAIWDLDVIINPKAILEGLFLMKYKRWNVVLPHNAIFVNVKGETKEKLLKDFDVALIPFCKQGKYNFKNKDLTSLAIPSGIVLINRKILLMEGGYNKKMISYAWDDIEILKRLNKLGYYYLIMGRYNIIHLDHPRGKDSVNNEFTAINKTEFKRIIKMSRSKLEEYIRNELTIDNSIKSEEIQKIRNNIRKRNKYSLHYIRSLISRLRFNIVGRLSK